jgi:hypothetical protein
MQLVSTPEDFPTDWACSYPSFGRGKRHLSLRGGLHMNEPMDADQVRAFGVRGSSNTGLSFVLAGAFWPCWNEEHLLRIVSLGEHYRLLRN